MSSWLPARAPGWSDLLRPGIRRAIGVSFCLAILIHVSGINTVIDYAPSIFQSAGWQIDAALFATFMVGVTNFVFTLASFWLIDRWGRKPLYITGSLVMGAMLLCLTLLSVFNAFQGKLVPLLVMTYLAFFASCIGPVFWTLVPEIFPNRLRGTAMSVPVLTQWITNAFVVLLFPLAFHRLGKSITFGFLAAMCLLQAIFTHFYVPETKNRTLEEYRGVLEMNLRCYMNLMAFDSLPTIREAGFDGVQFANRPTKDELSLCRSLGLGYAGSGRVNTPSEAFPLAAALSDDGCECATLHVGWGLEDDDEAFRLIESILEASAKNSSSLFTSRPIAPPFARICGEPWGSCGAIRS